jgi:hypothetical protein
MSKHDRQYESVTADGQKIIIVEGPSEIASWVFPMSPRRTKSALRWQPKSISLSKEHCRGARQECGR